MIDAFDLAVVKEAATKSDLNDAIRMVQDYIGQTDGGLAGQVFSDEIEKEWPRMSANRKAARLEAYMGLELKFMKEEMAV